MRPQPSRIGDTMTGCATGRCLLSARAPIALVITIVWSAASVVAVPAYAQTTSQVDNAQPTDPSVVPDVPPSPVPKPPKPVTTLSPEDDGPGAVEIDRALAQMQERAALGRSISRATQTNRSSGLAVLERPRPRYTADGIKVGAFSVFPVASIDAVADSNVFRLEKARGDVSMEPALQVTARSDWVRHALELSGKFENHTFAKYSSENANIYSASANGRVDVAGRSFLTLAVEHAHDIVQRGSIGGVPITKSPIRFDRTQYSIGGTFAGPIISLTGTGAVVNENYFDAIGPTGAVVDQQYRDLTQYRVGASVDYYVRPRSSIYSSAELDLRRYRVVRGFIRDSDAMTLLIGIRGEITPVIRGTLGFGILHQNFKDPRISDSTSFTFDGNIEWLVTKLTTVKFTARRDVANSVNVATPTQLLTTFTLNADHEILRNLIASAQVTRQYATFAGFGPKDSRWRASLGAQYLVNKRLSVRGDIGTESRRTHISSTDPYSQVTARLGLTYRI